MATEVTRPVDEDFEIKYQFYNPYNFLLVKDSESSVTLSGTWGWFSYDGEVYYGDNLKIYGPSIHRVNGESYAYEMHLRGTTLQNYQKILVVFFESDDYDSHNEIMDALGFWGNSVEMMEIGQEKEITQMIDMHASFGYGNTQFLEYTGKDFSGDCQDIDYIVSATTISISPHQSYAFGLDTFAYYPTRDMTYETQIFQNWEPIVESQPPVKPPVTPMTTPQPATSGSIPHPINPVAPNNIKPPPASLVDPRVAAQKPLPSGPASPPTKPVTPAHPNTPFSPYEVPKTQLPSNYSQPIIDQGKPIPATQPIIPTTKQTQPPKKAIPQQLPKKETKKAIQPTPQQVAQPPLQAAQPYLTQQPVPPKPQSNPPKKEPKRAVSTPVQQAKPQPVAAQPQPIKPEQVRPQKAPEAQQQPRKQPIPQPQPVQVAPAAQQPRPESVAKPAPLPPVHEVKLPPPQIKPISSEPPKPDPMFVPIDNKKIDELKKKLEEDERKRKMIEDEKARISQEITAQLLNDFEKNEDVRRIKYASPDYTEQKPVDPKKKKASEKVENKPVEIPVVIVPDIPYSPTPTPTQTPITTPTHTQEPSNPTNPSGNPSPSTPSSILSEPYHPNPLPQEQPQLHTPQYPAEPSPIHHPETLPIYVPISKPAERPTEHTHPDPSLPKPSYYKRQPDLIDEREALKAQFEAQFDEDFEKNDVKRRQKYPKFYIPYIFYPVYGKFVYPDGKKRPRISPSDQNSPFNPSNPDSPYHPENSYSPFNPKSYSNPSNPLSPFNPNNLNSPFNRKNPSYDPKNPDLPSSPTSPFNPNNVNSIFHKNHPMNPNNPKSPFNPKNKGQGKIEDPGAQKEPAVVSVTKKPEAPLAQSDPAFPGITGDNLKAMQESAKANELSKKIQYCYSYPCLKEEVGRVKYCEYWSVDNNRNNICKSWGEIPVYAQQVFKDKDSKPSANTADTAPPSKPSPRSEPEPTPAPRNQPSPPPSPEPVPLPVEVESSPPNKPVPQPDSSNKSKTGLINGLKNNANDLADSIQRLPTGLKNGGDKTPEKAVQSLNLKRDCETKLEVVLNRHRDSTISDNISQTCGNIKSLAQLNFLAIPTA